MPRPWLWLLGAVVGAAAVYFFSHRPAGSIPVPGEPAESAAKARAPQEQITNSDREALDRVLRERAKPR
jgi:uncharacterized membrane protein